MEELRRLEFSRLDASGHDYLDYTGAGLYPESLVRIHSDVLLREIFGNPHSHSPSSIGTTGKIEAARNRVLTFFDADPDEYQVVFVLYSSVQAYRCFDLLSPGEFSLQQFSACMGNKPVRAIRASLGIASNEADVHRFVQMLKTFVDQARPDSVRTGPEIVGD